MQSYLQYRRFYQELEKQIVIKREKPDNVWTHERRYWYKNDEICSNPRDPEDGAPAERRRTHGHQTAIGGPRFEPRHTTRSHLERDGDVERADLDPEVQADPYTINTRDAIGGDVDMMVTGVERQRPTSQGSNNGHRSVPDGNPDIDAERDSSEQEKQIMVSYEGDCDPMDPHNWPFPRRVRCTVLISLLAAVTWWSTTIDVTALPSTRALWHTSIEVQTVPTGMCTRRWLVDCMADSSLALFLIALGFGGLVTAPVSEVIGRNPVYLSMLPLFILFIMGAGLANTLVQRSVCRGLAGLFGSALLVCSAAAVVDLWSLAERVYVFPFFAMVTFMGAIIAITPGSYIAEKERITHSLSWRWVDWVTMIFAGILLVLIILFMPETYSPILLRWKARQLRRLTGDDRYRAPLEFRRVSFPRRLGHALYRPVLLFWTEPIIMIFAFYQTILFIILYTFSAGFIAVFQEPHQLSQSKTGLTFLALGVGVLLAGLLIPLAAKLTRRRIYKEQSRGPYRPEPELNLYLAMFGAPLIPIGLFWMGWTASPSISTWVPLGGAVLFGSGVLCVFVSSLMYVASTFEYHPASALASLQLLRLIAAGVMAIIAHVMYKRLGVHWTSTLLGCIALFFLPVPYLLFQWGYKVRKWSRYAQSEPG